MNDQLKTILEQQLRDIHTPSAVSWWPLAFGWWLLIAVVVCVVIVSMIALIKYRRKTAYRKIAISELDKHFANWQLDKSNSRYLQAANALLKRVCSHIEDNTGSHSTSLSSEAWVAHLNAYAKTDFSTASSAAIAEQVYQQSPSSDIDHIHHELRTWLAKHSSDTANKSTIKTKQETDKHANTLNDTEELTHA